MSIQHQPSERGLTIQSQPDASLYKSIPNRMSIKCQSISNMMPIRSQSITNPSMSVCQSIADLIVLDQYTSPRPIQKQDTDTKTGYQSKNDTESGNPLPIRQSLTNLPMIHNYSDPMSIFQSDVNTRSISQHLTNTPIRDLYANPPTVQSYANMPIRCQSTNSMQQGPFPNYQTRHPHIICQSQSSAKPHPM